MLALLLLAGLAAAVSDLVKRAGCGREARRQNGFQPPPHGTSTGRLSRCRTSLMRSRPTIRRHGAGRSQTCQLCRLACIFSIVLPCLPPSGRTSR